MLGLRPDRKLIRHPPGLEITLGLFQRRSTATREAETSTIGIPKPNLNFPACLFALSSPSSITATALLPFGSSLDDHPSLQLHFYLTSGCES